MYDEDSEYESPALSPSPTHSHLITPEPVMYVKAFEVVDLRLINYNYVKSQFY